MSCLTKLICGIASLLLGSAGIIEGTRKRNTVSVAVGLLSALAGAAFLCASIYDWITCQDAQEDDEDESDVDEESADAAEEVPEAVKTAAEAVKAAADAVKSDDTPDSDAADAEAEADPADADAADADAPADAQEDA